MVRTRQAAEIVQRVTGTPYDIIEEPGFGYKCVTEDPSLPRWNVRDVETELGEGATVHDWFLRWPPAMALRQRFFMTLCWVAACLQRGMVYVASHSPTCELIGPDPGFPRLGKGDIILGRIAGDYKAVYPTCTVPALEIVEFKYLPCPKVD